MPISAERKGIILYSREEMKRVIATPHPQELFREALKTFPAEIDVPLFDLRYDALATSGDSEFSSERYLDLCREMGVMPSLKAEFSWRWESFDLVLTRRQNYPEAQLVKVLAGGRPEVVEFVSHQPDRKGFESFRSNFLEQLVENGYWFSYGTLALSYDMTHAEYSWGSIVRTCTLTLWDHGKGMGVLRLDQLGTLEPGKAQRLAIWLNELRSRYHDKSLVHLNTSGR